MISVHVSSVFQSLFVAPMITATHATHLVDMYKKCDAVGESLEAGALECNMPEDQRDCNKLILNLNGGATDALKRSQYE